MGLGKVGKRPDYIVIFQFMRRDRSHHLYILASPIGHFLALSLKLHLILKNAPPHGRRFQGCHLNQINYFSGERVVLYLYVRYRFGWNEVDYSMFILFSFIVSVFGKRLI